MIACLDGRPSGLENVLASCRDTGYEEACILIPLNVKILDIATGLPT